MCAREEMITQYKTAIANGTIANCTVAWIQNLLRNDKDFFEMPCSKSDEKSHWWLLKELWIIAYRGELGNCSSKHVLFLKISTQQNIFSLLTCLEQCQHVSYKVAMKETDMYSGKNLLTGKDEAKLIFFYYIDTSVVVSKEVQLMTFNGFVSAFGGSLGLFLGFSCLSTLQDFVNLIKTKLKYTN